MLKTRESRIALLVAIGVLAAVCLRRPLSLVQDMTDGRQFPQALARAKAAGLPTRTADLQQPSPPPAQNAAPVYTRLMQVMKARPLTPDEEPAELLRTGTMPSPTQWTQAARLEHERPELLRLVHQAATRPRCAFTREWAKRDPATIEFPELATVREAARLLAAESLLLAHRGRMLEAVKNQSLGFQIARHGASDNTLIAGLVGIAVDAITLRGFEKIMYLAGPNAAVDEAVAATIARDWRPRSLASALKTESAFDLGEIAYLRSHPPSSVSGTPSGVGLRDPLKPLVRPLVWNAALDYNGLYVLCQMQKAISVADRPYPQAIHDLKSIGDDLQGSHQDPHQDSRFIAEDLLPDPAAAAVRWAQIQALVNVDRDGAATLAQYARTGHIPDRPARAALDPFSLRPLRYRREGKGGFIVYSVGPGGTWDGRDLKDAPKRFHAYFRYPTPQPQEGR